MSGTVFKNKIEMRNFAYDGNTGMKEERVKGAVAAFLRAQGYTVAIGKERERGPDIRATKDELNLVVEAKGEGSRSEMFNNYFLNALGEIIQRRNMQIVEIGIALPAHSKYVRLTAQLDDSFVRWQLRLNFYFVRAHGFEDYEVGLLKWDVK